MRAALDEACTALTQHEVPIGAVLVTKGEIIARGHNQSITTRDPTAHAEMVVIRQAGSRLGNYRLTDAELYVTVEPCIMCMGAIVHARLKKLFFGCCDPRTGAAGSVFDFSRDPRLNHSVTVNKGMLAQECQSLIQNFFKDKR